MTDPVALGRRIQERRKHQGLTQEQLGNDLFVSPQAVSKWENGESLLVSRRRDRLTKLGRRGARLTRRLSEPYRGCTGSEGNAVSRDGSASQCRHISATGH